jgi:hypothetical protein
MNIETFDLSNPMLHDDTFMCPIYAATAKIPTIGDIQYCANPRRKEKCPRAFV